jgi:serpin B
MIVCGTEFKYGFLRLPKFRIEYTADTLAEALVSLGVPLFNPASAPLTGGLLQDGGIPVWLSGALQKAMIEIDENGAKAAAVTVMPAPGSAPPPEQQFEMICDKPFMFMLYADSDNGPQVMFTGVVNQP